MSEAEWKALVQRVARGETTMDDAQMLRQLLAAADRVVSTAGNDAVTFWRAIGELRGAMWTWSTRTSKRQ